MQQTKIVLGFGYTDVELILAITFRKYQGLARRKGKKERVTPEFGERKEEKKFYPQIQGVTLRNSMSSALIMCIDLRFNLKR